MPTANKHGITMGLVILILGLLLAACDLLSDITKSAETNKPQNDKAEIASFVLNDKTGTIKQSTGKITFIFKKRTNAKDLTAKVLGLSAGATISPNPATTKNYTNPVLFTITSEDGTQTKLFTVSVTVLKKKNDKAEITSFVLNGKTGTIKQSTGKITFTFKKETDASDLTAKVLGLSAGATISPNPATTKNYTNPVLFTITSEDGTQTKLFTVSVTVLKKKNDKAEITSFVLNGKTGTIKQSTGKITFTFKKETDASDLTAKVLGLSAGATISPNPATTKNYTNPVLFTITAEDGTTKTFTVKVKVTKNDKADVESFGFGVPKELVKIVAKTITVRLPYGTATTQTATVLRLSAGAEIKNGFNPTISSFNYTSEKTFTVSAEDGTTKTFTVKVKVLPPNTEAEILEWRFGNTIGVIDHTKQEIKFSYPFGTSVNNLTSTWKLSDNATISPNPATNKNYTNPVLFTITAEDGTTTKTFTVKVKVLSNKAKILEWKFEDTIGGIDQKNQEIKFINYPLGTRVNNLTSTWKVSDKATILPNPAMIKDFTSDQVFTVTAEDGTTTQTYTVKVKISVTDENLFELVYKQIRELGDNASLNHLDLSGVTNMKDLFHGDNDDSGSDNRNPQENQSLASRFNGDISRWQVDKVTDMSYMFYNATDFNQSLNDWKVKNVTSMRAMFYNATAFNQSLNDWDLDKVTNMRAMFADASSFNGDISNWQVDEVINMSSMFANAADFNGNISTWKVNKVKDMGYMFYNARSFNQSLNDWKVNNVTNMSSMFANAADFNGDISTWKVNKVTNMSSMFSNATDFNQSLNDWKVNKVTNMSYMFYGADSFNGNISTWKVKNVTSMRSMFAHATDFNGNISTWKVKNVTNMHLMFASATAFNQSLNDWDVAKVTNMAHMFDDATAFDQDLSDWNTHKVKDCTNFSVGSPLKHAHKPTAGDCHF